MNELGHRAFRLAVALPLIEAITVDIIIIICW